MKRTVTITLRVDPAAHGCPDTRESAAIISLALLAGGAATDPRYGVTIAVPLESDKDGGTMKLRRTDLLPPQESLSLVEDKDDTSSDEDICDRCGCPRWMHDNGDNDGTACDCGRCAKFKKPRP
jgi:hypothetical protein